MVKAIVFPGQGSQFLGMGIDLFNEFPEFVKKANTILGYDIPEVCLNNPDNLLNQTHYTQPILYLVNYLYYQKYLEKNSQPHYFLGHSLGEFNALQAAGFYDFETGLQIVKKRGELMITITNSSMAAVIGADYTEVTDILAAHFPDIDIANINTPSQIVISGLTGSLELAADFFEDEGLAYVPLKVSGAFHSRYMAPVKEDFLHFIQYLPLGVGITPVIANHTGLPYPTDRASIIQNMVNQIHTPVKWLQSIQYLLQKDEVEFVELGPGEVLTNVIKKIKAAVA